jgi:catecholate siderophore receptor
MRGFDSSGSIFVDGVRNTTSASRDVYNIEQVEIAKGPAGADAGRGGTSGYVNLVTKTPQATDFARTSASYGVSEDAGEDQRRTTLDVNQSLTRLSPGAAFRLNLVGQDSGTPGRDETNTQTWGISPSLALGLGTPTRLVLAASYDHQNNLPDSGVPAAAVKDGLFLDPALGTAAPLTPVASPITGDIMGNYYGLANEDYEHVIQRSLMARVEHDFTPDLKLSNQTKVGETRRDALTSYIQNGSSYNAGSNTVTPRRIRNQTDNEILSNLTNLTAVLETGFVEHTVSTGVELTRETQFSPTYTAADGSRYRRQQPRSHPSRHVRADPVPRRQQSLHRRPHRHRSALRLRHAQAPREAPPQSQRPRRILRQRVLLLGRPSRPHSFPPLSTSEPTAPCSPGKPDSSLNPAPKAASTWPTATPSSRPARTSPSPPRPGNANDPGLDPQEAVNYEAGVKWEFFDRRLSTNLAVFRSINGNVATNIGTTPAPIIVYDSEQRTEGVEFGISGKITPEWLVFGGIGYLESEIDSPSTAATDGASLRFTPRLSGSIFTTYALTKRLTDRRRCPILRKRQPQQQRRCHRLHHQRRRRLRRARGPQLLGVQRPRRLRGQ